VKAKAQKKSSVQRLSADQKRVLVINETPNASFVSALESAGLKVVGIATAAAAAIALRRSRPHVVIASTEIKRLSTSELTPLLQRDNDCLPLILVGADAATSRRRHEALEAGAFDYFQIPAELELLTLRVAQLVSLRQVIDKLRGEADLDTLTGLANRRRFRVALSREVERWRRYGVPCSLLLLDIDFMKRINDTYGHPAGDLVLREVAGTLSKASRDNDTAARLGGEEFALLCANVGATQAEFAANRLRAILAEQQIEGVGNITVSIGVAACPEHANSERTLYTASDRALYVAKNEGRNRVAVAPRLQEELPELKHRN
jgi:diguanylate cyclase (GGDEF)-like protein